MNHSKGFTLIEMVVAIFLLTAGTVGAFALIQRTAVFTSISSSRLVATYLAQEAVEIIRNIRDTNFLEGNDWIEGIGLNTDYRLDYRSTSFPDATCGDYLKYENGFYICSSDTSGKFQRQIIITQPVADQITVSVMVSWQERGIDQQILVETALYNWR